MTNKEASERLRGILGFATSEITIKDEDALNIAINVLEAQPEDSGEKVYVVVQTLEYQDFETHYETSVLDIFSTKEAAQAFIDSDPGKDDSHIEFYKENFYGEVYYNIREMEVK